MASGLTFKPNGATVNCQRRPLGAMKLVTFRNLLSKKCGNSHYVGLIIRNKLVLMLILRQVSLKFSAIEPQVLGLLFY